jgi:hypothetical protein
MPMRFSSVPRDYFVPGQRWEHFDDVRTEEEGGDYRLFYEHLASVSYQGGLTPREIIEKMAGQPSRPFPIDSLDQCLNLPVYPKGGAIFGWTGDKIEEFVDSYPGLRWWISKQGLVIAKAGPKDPPISEFDRLAGKLWLEHSQNGRLSYAGLVKIAAALDAAGLPFKENLEPSQRKVFAAEAEKTKKPSPKTFSAAVSSPNHARRIRAIRLRLSRAKKRYEKSVYWPR